MRHNPTNRPTMGDYCRHIADAAQRHGTITNSNGFMMDEDTAEITLNAIADLAGFIPCISVNDLAALMDVTHEYTSRATTPNAQHTANKAHEALTGLISLYAAVNKIRPELEAMETATANYESQCREAKREQSRQ